MAKFGLLRVSFLFALALAALISVSRGQSNLKRSQMAANEASVVASLRTLGTALTAYATTYHGFPLQLADLGPSNPPSASHANLIDPLLASGQKSGYVFTYTRGTRDLQNGKSAASYSLYADPVTENTTGTHHFYMDDRHGIYYVLEKP